ncbi:MAG: S9 family peptidase [Bacteroidetes bacterium]|nr:MAG: S9 family peptidase [Bacteroidota bacterium]
MNKFSAWTCVLFFAMACSSEKKENTKENMVKFPEIAPPVAKIAPKELENHGQKRTDNYFWLRERENPEVTDYLKAENAYADTMLGHTKDLQDKLFGELKGRIKEKDQSAPVKIKDYVYYTRYEEGGEYALYCRRKGNMEGKEEILLNGNEMGKGKPYFAIGNWTISPDQQTLAYGVDTVSRRIYTIYFKNLATGELLKDQIAGANPNFVWANDNKTLFYTSKNLNTLRAERVNKHTLGTDSKKDPQVYFEKDETYNLSIGKTKSDEFLVISAGSTLSSESLILDANKPNDKFKVALLREKDHLYDLDHANGKFYITSNWEAKNFRLLESDLAQLSDKSKWKEVIAHRADVLLENVILFKDHLVLQEKKGGLNRIKVIKWADKSEHELSFEEPAYLASLGSNPELNTAVLRYNYQSLSTPSSSFDYDLNTKNKTLVKQQEILGGYQASNYATERVFATAKDGTKIPMALVYRKDTFKKDGTNPTLQYAYGSYGISTEAYFRSNIISLLDRGFVYVLCNIRGGQEMGRQWYEDGKLLKKKNTFTDFIDCSEFLIKEKYSAKDKLFAQGGSAGGLLMGAIANMRPDLYKGILAIVPFVDVINTMLDSSIPLTTFEYDEWGNPNDKTYFDYMMSYSPYDNVSKQNYANMLVMTGFHDSQVQYWEPAKWVAKLRASKTDKNVLIFKTNMDAGHGGASGRFQPLKEQAYQYSFMLALLGVNQ